MTRHSAGKGGWPPTGFGRRLAELREAQGLSQQELADRVGVHPMTVSKTERGEQEPGWPLVLALAKALGVGVGAFVADETAPPGAPRTRRAGVPLTESAAL